MMEENIKTILKKAQTGDSEAIDWILKEYSKILSFNAQKYYLPENELNVTETVRHFRDFLPHFLPLVHPSPRNQIWLKKNPWFEQEIIPVLQKQIKAILSR